MNVHVLYGDQGKEIPLPDGRTVVIQPKAEEPLQDEEGAVREALQNPIGCPRLRDLLRDDDQAVIVFSDLTRPVPYDWLLPPLLEELNGLPDERILFLNALGTHRPNTEQELAEILGPEVCRRYPIYQHDCRDRENLVNLGETSYGHPIWINRRYWESRIRILTGFIEPHLFAGYSGGPKAVLPGVAGWETIVANHGSDMIACEGAGFARAEGNPIWEEMMEVALRTEATFLLNVTQTASRCITAVFAGDLQAAHRAGVDFVRGASLVPVQEPFDIVVSAAGGYPLDMSMYQSVKGIAVAADIVREGGAIILVSECREGLPDYGEYGEIMRLAADPDHLVALMDQPGFMMQDQWDAQIQAQICRRVRLYIHSEGLSEAEIRQVFGIPCPDVGNMVQELLTEYGPQARVAVIPAGPLTVPYRAEKVD
jgi:nickel-dependent lactate racemase